ncbi:alpha/beta hydrolase [Nocardia sp. NBC_01499]|uniref:alpha/beta hydrolase n=1 Tax=Nocardia sp. NBC_01499 TaxID=2903597 RepID=UPI003865B147
MNDTIRIERLPLGIRLLHALRKDPDWSTITPEELITFRDKANRVAAARFSRVITGLPDRGAEIRWQEVTLPDRVLRVRVYRPSAGDGGTGLPLVLHVHGGGFVGTAAQCDWANSHLAARLPAVVVSVEHRLLAPGTPLADAVDDGWDVLRHVVQHAAEWGIDPARIAVAGESTGGLIAALAAIRAKASGLHLRAQVLINPACDLTETMYDYPSIAQHAHSPMLTVSKLRLFQRLAVPAGTDRRAVSPMHAADLSGLAPALVVVPTIDPVADQGRRYAERLREFDTPATLTEYPGAPHAFITLPGVVPQAKVARAEITEFLRGRLAGAQSAAAEPTEAQAR